MQTNNLPRTNTTNLRDSSIQNSIDFPLSQHEPSHIIPELNYIPDYQLIPNILLIISTSLYTKSFQNGSHIHGARFAYKLHMRINYSQLTFPSSFEESCIHTQISQNYPPRILPSLPHNKHTHTPFCMLQILRKYIYLSISSNSVQNAREPFFPFTCMSERLGNASLFLQLLGCESLLVPKTFNEWNNKFWFSSPGGWYSKLYVFLQTYLLL
jgi:hypothetical protein